MFLTVFLGFILSVCVDFGNTYICQFSSDLILGVSFSTPSNSTLPRKFQFSVVRVLFKFGAAEDGDVKYCEAHRGILCFYLHTRNLVRLRFVLRFSCERTCCKESNCNSRGLRGDDVVFMLT